MARPKKWRKVCCMPRNTRFAPIGENFDPNEAIVMTVDEYETTRLIDHEGFTQEECAEFMKIGRTTVQQIYNTARKKLSASLVNGKPLIISGGEYRLCDGKETHCNCGGCNRHRRRRINNKKGNQQK